MAEERAAWDLGGAVGRAAQRLSFGIYALEGGALS